MININFGYIFNLVQSGAEVRGRGDYIYIYIIYIYIYLYIYIMLQVTPMREAVIPPPMSAYEIHLESQVFFLFFFRFSYISTFIDVFKNV